MQEIWALKPSALAFFGKEVENALHEFWGHYIQISTSAEAYIQPSGDQEFEQRVRETVFGGEELTQRITASVEKLESHLLPVIRAEGAKQAATRSTAPPSSPTGNTSAVAEPAPKRPRRKPPH